MTRMLLAFAAIMLMTPATIQAMSGMQMSRDGRQVMVNKDVGDERWVIMFDPDNHTAMGNVFFPSGGAPAFVWCAETGDDGNPNLRQSHMMFACYGAGTCTTDPCDSNQWSFIDQVTLPGSFFMPPEMPGPGMMR